jgi:hypothetical protein
MDGFQPLGDLLPKQPEKPRPIIEPTPDELPLSDRDELILELVQVGIGLRKAKNLVDHYPVRKIRRQLQWLPLRGARRPASLLIAAIENDYDAPAYE